MRKEPFFRDIAEELRDFIADRTIVAHGADWQKRMLHAEFKRSGHKGLQENQVFCTKKRLEHYLNSIQDKNMDLSFAQALRLFAVSKNPGKIKGAFEKSYFTLQLAMAVRALDDLPGSVRECWQEYFNNFQTQAGSNRDGGLYPIHAWPKMGNLVHMLHTLRMA